MNSTELGISHTVGDHFSQVEKMVGKSQEARALCGKAGKRV
jgi:hypothetical protein